MKEIDKLKSAFVANVAHVFKNPLAIINESLGVVLDGVTGEITPEQRAALERGKHGTERLISLVTELVELSEIEAGRTELKRKRINPASLLNEILAGIRKELSWKKVRLQKIFPKKKTPIWADEDKLKEAVISLLNNAIGHTPAGGRIVVKLKVSGGMMRFEISNSGTSVSKDVIQKMFDKFEHITGCERDDISIGLPIARDIIELHKGALRVEDAGSKGSRFVFTLPCDLRKGKRRR